MRVEPAPPGAPDEIAGVLLDRERIRARIAELGAAISEDYAGREIILITVLRGGVFFLADLCRAIDAEVRLDFMAISSYGPSEHPGGVRITKDLDEDIEGAHVLVVEDIIDTGLTLNYLLRYLRGKNPKSIKVCSLLDKPARRLVEIPIDYVGFEIPDAFVVGYGLDFGEVYRNLRFVGVLRPEAYES